jgi:hypothetical protein
MEAEKNRARNNTTLKFPIRGDYIFKISFCQKKNGPEETTKKVCRDILFRI